MVFQKSSLHSVFILEAHLPISLQSALDFRAAWVRNHFVLILLTQSDRLGDAQL